MKSDTTFNDEFTFLFNNLRDALDLQSEIHPIDTFGDYFNSNSSENLIDTTDTLITRLPDNLDEELFFEPENLMVEYSNNVSNVVNELQNIAMNSALSIEFVQNIVIKLGTDAFGFYLPMHQFYKNKHNSWGIYLFPEIIGPYIHKLHNIFNSVISIETLIKYFMWCVYRHELFHFQTEYFATGKEVLIRKPFYLNYQNYIFRKYAGTEDWLEEALAEASVLESRLVSKRSGLNIKIRRAIYEYSLQGMPPGYRDYKCIKYGGTKQAHTYLAGQIIHLDNVDPQPTQINTIKREYLFNDKKVPVYMVSGLKSVIRIQ